MGFRKDYYQLDMDGVWDGREERFRKVIIKKYYLSQNEVHFVLDHHLKLLPDLCLHCLFTFTFFVHGAGAYASRHQGVSLVGHLAR